MFAPSTAVRRGFVCALAAVLVTSGCAAGRDAQTQNQVPSQDGTNANAGSMALRGIALTAPTSGAAWSAGSTIPMRLVLVNNGTSTDRLTNIVTSAARGWAGYRSAAQASAAASAQTASTTPGTSGASASTSPGAPSSSASSSSASSSSAPATSSSTTGAETAISIPAGQRVSFGVPDSQRVLALLSSLGHLYAGTTVKVTFTFAKAGSVTAAVPVQTTTGKE
ncbi:hypothetical protein [Jatrophihabitans endophyticus]|uniref:hypothetical protein n=1 Tax=Jatrophihabitans endophyticus TaxID=1206085 RepID=UPI001A016C96|nr:hypothetical protein [Jatrophihabitans endophyticus]MBE7189326.1 hypothetical protein [Jatrophihabitans endophyticus]